MHWYADDLLGQRMHPGVEQQVDDRYRRPERVARAHIGASRIAVYEAIVSSGAPVSPVRVAPQVGLSVGAVAHHFRALHRLGLIALDSTRQRRGATEHRYRLA